MIVTVLARVAVVDGALSMVHSDCVRTALHVASICRLAQPMAGPAILLPRKALRADGRSTAWLAPQVATGAALEQVAGMADRQVVMTADMLLRRCSDENARVAKVPWMPG